MSKLNLNPMADWGYVNNSRFRFLSIRNQGGGVEPEPPTPPERSKITYTASEDLRDYSEWIKENTIADENTFDSKTGEGELVLNEGVTAIGEAFNSCTALASVTIPNSVTAIGEYAFNSCTALASVTIPDSVTTIGLGAFKACNSLKSVTIPNSVTAIGEYAFYGCAYLTSITCKATVPPTLDEGAFDDTKDCPIYVPADSIAVYKSAWSNYSSRIEAIQEGGGK